MKYPDELKKWNITKSVIILFVCELVIFTILVMVKYYGSLLQRTFYIGDIIKSISLNGFIGILTFCFNKAIAFVVEEVTLWEHHLTKSCRFSSLIFKIIFTQTFNTVVIFFFLYLLNPIEPLLQYGLAPAIFDLILWTGLINLGIEILLPVKTLKKWWTERQYYPDRSKPVPLFQGQLNKMVQKPEFELENRFSYFIYTTYIAGFYGFVLPTATPSLIILFSLQYWVDKYNIFRRFSAPNFFGFKQFFLIYKFFEISILLFVIGYVFWQPAIHFDAPRSSIVINLINLTLAFLFVLAAIFVPDRMIQQVLGE
jgi:hypothetical protein